MQFWLHPIVVWPQCSSPLRTLRIAKRAGYRKIVVAPLRGWDSAELVQIPGSRVGSIEEAWHPLTQDNVFQQDALLRVVGRRTETNAPLPWDNLFWGDRGAVQARMHLIRLQFANFAIFSGHAPENNDHWPIYAWEINPDHGIYGEEVLKVPGKFSVDMLHLTRPARADSSKRVVAPEDLLDFLRKLVRQRGRDIAIVHLHLAAKEIVPYSLGLVPPDLEEGLKILSSVDMGNLPIAVQFMPPAPVNLTALSASFFLRRIREVTEGLLAPKSMAQLVPQFA